MSPEQDTLQEIYRLAKDNNRMLHAMRRNAFIGGIIKILVYVVLFIGLPLWLYVTYLAPTLENLLNTMNQIQGTGASAQLQLDKFKDTLGALNPAQYFGQ